MEVDPSNAEQLRSWDGPGGAYWTAHADRFEAGVARYDDAFFHAAAIAPADRVLDVGCGSGRTTREMARRAADGSALGVDLSSEMIALARTRAARAGLGNAVFEQADAQVHPFPAGAFDLAVSRNGVMFFGDPVAAFANIARSLRPGGRLVLLVWQAFEDNPWLSEFVGALPAGRDMLPPPGAPGPFSMADPTRVRGVLSAAGFSEARFADVRQPMWLGADTDDAHRFVSGQLGWMLERLDEHARTSALHMLREVLDAHRNPDGVLLGSAAWVVTAVSP